MYQRKLITGGRWTDQNLAAFLTVDLVTARHADDTRMEFGEDVDEIGLRGHDGPDVLVGAWRFIESAAEQLHLADAQRQITLLRGDGLDSISTRHAPAGTVGGGKQGVRATFSAD